MAYPLPLFHAAGFRRKHEFDFWNGGLIIKLSFDFFLLIREVLILRYLNYSAKIFKEKAGIDVLQSESMLLLALCSSRFNEEGIFAFLDRSLMKFGRSSIMKIALDHFS